jgi:hypothetical protein
MQIVEKISDMVATTNVNDNAQATTKISRALISSLVMRCSRRGGGIIGICLVPFD